MVIFAFTPKMSLCDRFFYRIKANQKIGNLAIMGHIFLLQ